MQLEQTFIALLQEHQKIIFKVSNLYMDDREDREDLFQEIALQAWKSFGNFKGASQFSTWLYRVAINTAITFLKKERKRSAIATSDPITEIIDEKPNPIEEQVQAMYKAIAHLSKIDKALVMLYLEDYNYADIAEMMGISANNVAVKINRLKVKLKSDANKYYQP